MKKVLVIEDDTDTIDFMDFLINDLGFEMIKSNAMLSVQQITAMHPDVIMIDYYLPDGHGSELCLQLKADLLTSAIPVILMSTHSNLRHITTECHADAYLEKPFAIDNMMNMITRLAS